MFNILKVKIMSETKTFVVPDNLTGNNNDNLATMAMMSNGGFGGNWNNPLTIVNF